MSKKYVGKLKSFDEVKKILKTVSNNWNIDFMEFLKDNELKDVTITQFSNCSYDNGAFILTENLFSEIKPVTEYYAIGADGSVYNLDNTLDNTIERFKRCYNYWDSEEQAKEVEKSMKLYRAMKWWSFCNDNGYEFIHNKRNILIYYDTYEKKYTTQAFGNTKSNMEVYFSTEEKAKQCLEWLKKEGLI